MNEQLIGEQLKNFPRRDTKGNQVTDSDDQSPHLATAVKLMRTTFATGQSTFQLGSRPSYISTHIIPITRLKERQFHELELRELLNFIPEGTPKS